ncbi:MAG TPA: glycosyltransferase family 2 protein [Patescibacteria group bacterium]|nr:glycosyltransferase family 2 protein [Patescibacteria group bacterium]
MKTVLRKGLSKSVAYAKKAVARSPRIKNIARSLILEHMSLQRPGESNDYTAWVAVNYPDAIDLQEEKEMSASFKYQPLISVLTPTYNTDIGFLYECIKSVQAQSYSNWELCIVDDASTDSRVRDEIKKFAKEDKRIKYSFRKENGHISKATNDALKMADGEFIALLDHDDVLWPNALFEMVKALNTDHKINFLYSDEEMVSANRRSHQNPFFKTEWNPEFLESVNYITHFAVLRKSLVEQVGGLRVGYEGAQDWDLFLRAAYATDTPPYHIPKVLYSWRMSETSTAMTMESKPYVRQAQKRAIQESLKSRGYKSAKVMQGVLKDYWNVVHPVDGDPKVSIVIPTKNQYQIVQRCVESIYEKTTYKNFEIVLVDTGSSDSRVGKWYKKLKKEHSNINILEWPEQPFSYARSCNFGAKNSTGEYIVFLNNDTEVLTAEWLELFLSDAQRDGIGAVGCKLYYPDLVHIQHAGIGIGFGGVAGNSLSMVHAKQRTSLQHIYGDTRHEVTAVTAACLMIRKQRFDQVGGFDEEFRVTYNDVDLCLRLKEAGLRNIYSPVIELIHHESISVGRPEEKKVRDTKEFMKAAKLFKLRWKRFIENDPNLNPNIERSNASFEVKKY